MRKLKPGNVLCFFVVVMVLAGLFHMPVFAETACFWCNSTTCNCTEHVLTTPISGDYASYELQIVRKTAALSVQTGSYDGTTYKVQIPVDAVSNDMFRGIQINLSKMQNISLKIYDDGGIVDSISNSSNITSLWSRPSYSDKIRIEVHAVSKKAKCVFKLESIKYNKSVQHNSSKKIEYLSLPIDTKNPVTIGSYQGEAENFKKYIDKLSISSPEVKVSNLASDYEKSQADVLYQVLHGVKSGDDWGLGFNPWKKISELKNESTVDWIIQKSCNAVNTDDADQWCKYLAGSSTHKTKGIFGYSEITMTSDAKISKEFEGFVIKSQTRPMLDSYLGTAAKISEGPTSINWVAYKITSAMEYFFGYDIDSKKIPLFGSLSGKNQNGEVSVNDISRDRHTFSTVIINENNIKDSMFRLTEPVSNSKFRFYRLSIKCDSNGNFDDKSFYNGLKVIKDEFNNVCISLQYKNPALSSKIVIGKNLTTMSDRDFVLDWLNNKNDDVSMEAFDNSVRLPLLSPMKEIPNYIQAYRKTNPILYKKLRLYYCSIIESSTHSTGIYQYSVFKPKVEIENYMGYYVAEYAELKLVSGKYVFVTDGSGVKWNKEILWGYTK